MIDHAQFGAPAFMEMLTSPVAEEVRNAATLIKYTDGRLIHSRGDNKPGISIVKTGAAHVGIYGVDGSFVMTSILGPGQCFGEFTVFTNLPRTHDVTAAGPTEIYQISGARFKSLYDNEPKILHALLSTSLLRAHILLEMLDAVRRLPLRERTAKIVLSMMQTTGSTHTLKCRQSDLAFTLGVSRVSLGKALKQLADLELIELAYGKINVPLPDQLAQWVSDNCSLAPMS